ncbi:MAG TPA: 16S rRNA (guanine(527)-N(7))-methyltransferase RsmG [Xanthobacteraceae bacterium]|jgi:16S rRNA (guanine527-N7)-methyltransferase
MMRAASAHKLADLAADRARALALTPVSRETAARLDRFVELLLTWQGRINLVAPSTVSHLWTRHVADSLQLLALAPRARHWIDLGAGAGFPGLMIAIALADEPGAAVDLVESNTKKAAFLREAQRLTGAPARVHLQRIEDFAASFKGHAGVVTARAVAPLKSLLYQSFPLLGKSGATGLFPKGQRAELELEDAAALMKSANMTATLVPSRTDPAGRIVVIRVEHGPTAP